MRENQLRRNEMGIHTISLNSNKTCQESCLYFKLSIATYKNTYKENL